MRAGRRHFQRPLDMFLTLDVGEVHGIDRLVHIVENLIMLERRDRIEVAEMRHQRGHGWHRDDVDARDQGGFRRVHLGQVDRLDAGLLRHVRHGQHAVDVAQAAVQAQLADEERVLQPVQRHLIAGSQQADRNRQVVDRPHFAQIRRRQVDRHPAARVREAGVHQCGAHALGRLLDRRVGQTHQHDGRQRVAVDIDFHLDGRSFEADD